jgi:endonuclease/exonuclease/phosphatase family metal-dependent hydrolase
MKNIVLTTLSFLFIFSCTNAKNKLSDTNSSETPIHFMSSVSESGTYKLVVYNVENLFDADGYAVFDDYKPDVYSPAHVFVKIDNIARLMTRYNNGFGPDVLVLSEIESDHTRPAPGTTRDVAGFLSRYAQTTLHEMLHGGFNTTIADLPSELLLIKGLADRGITGYDLTVAYGPLNNGRPSHVQKNVIFSRLPIIHDQTRVHPLEDARPILETWIDVHGHPLVVFANHWKSRASDAEVEKTRVQNATVLKARLDQLRAENPSLDFILGGDFNSDFNQSHRYPYMETTGVNDVLKSVGDEAVVAAGGTDKVYNLWYELPVDQRGSDVFRGYWGTLMQIMISPGMYDYQGIQYVDNSFERGVFPGKNAYVQSGTPLRWNGFGNGSGYSDHLPISMQFTVTGRNDPSARITLQNPSSNDDSLWSPIAVTWRLPAEGEYFTASSISGSLRLPEFFNELFLVETTVLDRARVQVNAETYDLFSPAFNVRDLLGDQAGQPIRFYGRLGVFRGTWQFVIESQDYIL